MKLKQLVSATTVGLTLTLALLTILTTFDTDEALAGGAGTLRYVLDDGGVDTGDCTDSQAPCRTVQYALARSQGGDAIQVANKFSAAIYTGTMVVTKSIVLEGGWNVTPHPSGTLLWNRPSPCEPSRTVLDAEGAGRVISITGSPSAGSGQAITPVIDCFTITGGDAEGLGGDPDGNHAGGGIYSRDAAPIIVHNVITGNYGCETCSAYGRGGGIYLLKAPATAIISDNLVVNNVADESTWGQGGGIMLRDSDAQVLSNTIEHNRAGHSAGYGGGIAIKDGRPTIADNVITFNYAGQSVQGLGGGIFVWSMTPATIERNEIRYNLALRGSGDANLVSAGGGIYCAGIVTTPVSAIIRDNFLEWNMASIGGSLSGDGGGIYLRNLSATSVVSGNALEWNRGCDSCLGHGGGIHVVDSEVTIENNEFARNTATWAGPHGEGGAFYVDGGAVVIQSNVITDNTGAYFPGLPSTSTGYGGGVAAVGGQTTVKDNTIRGNGGTNGENIGMGGGIYAYSGTLQIEGNTIADNYASVLDTGYGGGMVISSSLALVQGNLITNNQATSDTWGAGGGLYVLSGTVQIERNTIANNRVTRADRGFGGGLYLDQTHPWLESNVILGNVADDGIHGHGGGVRIGLCPVFTMTNNIVAHNGASELGSGVAIGGDGTGVLAHNTIAENQAGDGLGIQVGSGSEVMLTNNIIVSQTVGISNTDPAGSAVTATHTLFEGNGLNYGAGVSSGNEIPGPAALLADYHLGSGSNALDQGTPVSWVTNDIDDDPRPIGEGRDVGADEAWLRVFLPIVLQSS